MKQKRKNGVKYIFDKIVYDFHLVDKKLYRFFWLHFHFDYTFSKIKVESFRITYFGKFTTE